MIGDIVRLVRLSSGGMPDVVGAYARLSSLRGRDENIEEQHHRQTLAAQARWPGCEIRYYADPDASGEREDAPRPDFDRLLADLTIGTLTQVVTSDQERLTRRPEILEHLIDLLRSRGIEGILGYRDGWTSVIAGQTAGARYKGVQAKEYVEGVKVKVNEKLDLLASLGRPGPGTCFGYRHVKRDGRTWLEQVEEEAAAIRWAADTVLAGGTLTSVVAEFTRRGLSPRRKASSWSVTTVGQLLGRSAAIAGKRTHRGEIVGDGDWDPIIDEVTWRRLQARFADRQRQRPARTYLLTGGLAVCGNCGAPLIGQTQSRKNGPRWHVYDCHVTRHKGRGCGKVAASAASLEAHVEQVLKLYLASDEFAARVAARDPAAPERARLTRALEDVDGRRKRSRQRYARRELDDEEWDDLRAELAAEKGRLHAALAGLPAPTPGVDPAELLEDWDAMVLGEKRAVLRMALLTVRVDRATRRGPVFDTGRVHVFDQDGVELTVAP